MLWELPGAPGMGIDSPREGRAFPRCPGRGAKVPVLPAAIPQPQEPPEQLGAPLSASGT